MILINNLEIIQKKLFDCKITFSCSPGKFYCFILARLIEILLQPVNYIQRKTYKNQYHSYFVKKNNLYNFLINLHIAATKKVLI